MRVAQLKHSLRSLVAVAAAAVALIGAERSEASTYTVSQCIFFQGSVSDYEVDNESLGAFSTTNSCVNGSSSGLVQVSQNGFAATSGDHKQIGWSAPSGTQFNRVTGRSSRAATGGSGINAYVFAQRVGGAEQVAAQSTNGAVQENFDTDTWGGPAAPLRRIGAGLACQAATCGSQSASSGLGNMTFLIEDTTQPALPDISNSPLITGWVNGTESLSYSVHDTGAGVSYVALGIGGTHINDYTQCIPEVDGTLGNPTRLQPCPANVNSSVSVNTNDFADGLRELRFCTYEFGTLPQSRCELASVAFDNTAPAAPTSTTVADGEGWKRDRQFDISWNNPAQAHAPISSARIRVTGPGGYDNTVVTDTPTSEDDLTVPNVVGDYTATVYLRDAAGNGTVTNGSSVHLRYDNTIPAPQQPTIANGWISRSELAAGYLQRWDNVPDELVPPSGIAGYRVSVNTSADSDPCAGASDPRTCGGPLTEVGRESRTRILGSGDLVEGANYVHVAPVSGSGMRATQVRHTPLKVDVTDPVTTLDGDAADGWINRDAIVRAVSVDSLSGMVDTNEFASDPPPETFLTVGGTEVSDVDADVSATVTAEGSHEVGYWSRDLAGNTGQQSSSTIRIDKTAPAVAFSTAQDPNDPDMLIAPVSDALSGVVEGQISYREVGRGEWKMLDTAVRDSHLVSRVDSADLRPGVSYEFRVSAVDRAGNRTSSLNKSNGEPMIQVGPFRAITEVVGLKVNGKPKARTKHGAKTKVVGALFTHEGAREIANAPVEIIETFAAGSKRKSRSQIVLTDGAGRFRAVLGRGPTRSIVASFRGDQRNLGTSSEPAKLSVRSKVSLTAPRKVDSDGGITFAGKVSAKGARLGRRGKRLEVQVKVGKKWKAVGRSIHTDGTGSYELDYEFTAAYTEPVVFQFRAAVLREGGFPYLPSKSRVKNVTVTP